MRSGWTKKFSPSPCGRGEKYCNRTRTLRVGIGRFTSAADSDDVAHAGAPATERLAEA